MSVSGELDPVAAERHVPWPQRLCANVVGYFAYFGRKPRSTATPGWRLRPRLGSAALVAIIAVIMLAADAWTIGAVGRAPGWLTATFNDVTDFGKSVWVLVPVALMLAATAAPASPALARMSRGVLAAVAVRLGFLFLAISLPGLVFSIVKRFIGRARPLVGGTADPFLYVPWGWNVEYASLPSGHATDTFAIATAVGALWPSARPVLWTYAVVIAVSRVMVTAHFPSDVVAGAAIGTVGALLVRDWFARRGLAFVLAMDGSVRAKAGPSFARIKRVAHELIAP